MGLTGEKKDLLIAGMGEGNFCVYGLDCKNQMHIQVWAHEAEITQIVSLSGGLKNKYFATRDIKGHVKIWSSTNHPDKLFPLFNFDADEEALAHLQPVAEVVEVKEKKKKKKRGSDDEGEGEEEEEEEEEEEVPEDE